MRLAPLAALAWLAGAGPASADYFDDLPPEPVNVGSPERLALELRIGPYTPRVGTDAFDDTFPDETGPFVGFEIDAVLARIPYVGLVGAGLGAGWVSFTDRAFVSSSASRATEETSLTLFPLTALGVLRIDVLAREVGLPLVFTGKLGWDYVLWDANTGERDDAANGSHGLHYGLQAALELDFFDRRAARSLDEDWGINHSFLFAEWVASRADSTLRLHARTWTAGLGFVL